MVDGIRLINIIAAIRTQTGEERDEEMKLDKEIQEAIHSIKMSIFATNDMLEGEGMTEPRRARIEGKLNGLELALRIIEKM